jgi:anoctamin-7
MMQMAFIFTGDQIIGIILEFLVPKIKGWCQRRNTNIKRGGDSQIERDLALAENEGLLYEYLKLVLQFASVTIFVSAFPLAPFFALLNNWVEIRLDAKKFLCDNRRVPAERANDIGIWLSILSVVAQLSVILNAFQIAFTTDFVESTYYHLTRDSINEDYASWSLSISPTNYTGAPCYYGQFRDETGNLTMTHWKILVMKLGFVIVYEHFVLTFAKGIDYFLSDVPEKLQIKIKRNQYMCKSIASFTRMDSAASTSDDSVDNFT